MLDADGQDVTQQVVGADFSVSQWDGTDWSHDVTFPTAGVTWTVKVYQGGTLLASKSIEIEEAPAPTEPTSVVMADCLPALNGTYTKAGTHNGHAYYTMDVQGQSRTLYMHLSSSSPSAYYPGQRYVVTDSLDNDSDWSTVKSGDIDSPIGNWVPAGVTTAGE